MVLRHQKAALYHPFIDALALTLVDVPISVVNVSVLSVILYFMAGLQRTPVDYNTLSAFIPKLTWPNSQSQFL